MAVIQIDGQNALLEITDRCLTGCVKDYCYKMGTVGPKGTHVPLEVVIERLKWIKIFTNAARVTILGGEGLLHPNFIEICNHILNMGFGLDIITSGVVGKSEQKNLDYVFELFEKGTIDINLSYHHGRNEKQFENFVAELHKRVEKRHENLVLAGKDPKKLFDLFTRWTISRRANLDKVAFHKVANWIYDLVQIARLPIEDDDLAIAFDNYRQQFRDGTAQLSFNYYHINPEYTGLRVKTNIRGQQDIAYGKNGPEISAAEAGVCPGIASRVDITFVRLCSMIIRTNGGVSFGEAQCIDMLHPLMIVDPNQTRDEVYSAMSGSLRQIQSHVFLHNRVKASENCDKNGAEIECTACPFSRMCTSCWQTKRPWEKGE